MKQQNFLKLILVLFLTLSFNSFGQVFITELADPNDNTGARYVELYNQGDSPVDLSNWALRRWTNDNSSPQSDVSLSGTIAAKGFMLFVANSSSFDNAFSSFSGTRVQIGTGGPADSNGDDNIALIDNTGTLVDMFGVAGEDGTGTCHEFEDGRAERKSTVLTAKATWSEADWNVWADSTVNGCTSHTNDAQNVSEGFDPGEWIGATATAGITLGAVSGNTNESGTQATFTVVLNTQPTTDVVLDVSSGDTGEVTLNVSSLTFTNANWNSPQTVTATGVDDALSDGDVAVTVTISVNDGSSDDDYDPVADVTRTITNEDNEAQQLIINEILADPDSSTGDANGDGAVSTSNDEFVEIYNNSGGELDISGFKINDGFGLRHTFPQGTVLPTGGTIVVFGGGTVSSFTNVGGLAQVASSTSLGLNNGGDTVTILNASDVTIATYTYGSEGGNNQSIARNPDFTGAFETHSGITGNTVDFSPGKDNTDNSPFIKTWTGATDNVWATATNWLESDTPGASDHAIVRTGLSNYPTASAGTVTIASLIIESGASLVTTNTFTANVTYKRALTGSQWALVGSPVNGETYNDAWVTANGIASGSTFTTNRGISTYDNSSNTSPNVAGSAGHWRYMQGGGSGTFNDGQGYALIISSSADVSFTGSLNTSDQTFGVTQGVNNFNLVANPFTASITLGTFRTTNSGVIGTDFYFWNGSAYVTRTSGADASREIAPTQGFFVEATTGGNVTFETSDLSHQTDNFGQRSTTRPEIHVNVFDGSENRTARVLYIDGTTTGFDAGYDGKLFGGVDHDLALLTN